MLQRAHHVLDRRCLLTDGNVDTGHVLTFLVDDGVDGDSGLTRLAVTNDQFALATADRHHRVDGLQTGLHRLAHRLTCDHARGHFFDHVGHLGVDRAFAVDRLAQRVHHTANQLGADGHFQNTARALDSVAFGDVLVVTQNHRAHRVTLEVQRQAEGVVGKLQHLALHHIGQAVNAANTVGHRNHGALVANVSAAGQPLNAALDQLRNLCGIELHDSFLFL